MLLVAFAFVAIAAVSPAIGLVVRRMVPSWGVSPSSLLAFVARRTVASAASVALRSVSTLAVVAASPLLAPFVGSSVLMLLVFAVRCPPSSAQVPRCVQSVSLFAPLRPGTALQRCSAFVPLAVHALPSGVLLGRVFVRPLSSLVPVFLPSVFLCLPFFPSSLLSSSLFLGPLVPPSSVFSFPPFCLPCSHFLFPQISRP